MKLNATGDSISIAPTTQAGDVWMLVGCSSAHGSLKAPVISMVFSTVFSFGQLSVASGAT